MNSTSNKIQLPKTTCTVYRIIGSILLLVSIANIIATYHYFSQRYVHRYRIYSRNRLSSIMIGLSISSAFIIFAAAPFVALQCFTCQPYLNYKLFCKIHAFACFATGLFNMYIVVLLSFLRYLSITHKTSRLNQFFENHHDLCIVSCAIVALCWSLPSFFNIGNEYVPEDGGFYCSLKWDSKTIPSRIFTFSMVIFNYLVPLIIVLYSNVRVWLILRHLFKTRHYLNIILLIDQQSISIDKRLKENLNRLQKLKLDQRYALIISIIAAQYIIVWTPYTLIIVSKYMEKTEFLDNHPFLPTLFALFAKISLIVNPLVLIFTNKITSY